MPKGKFLLDYFVVTQQFFVYLKPENRFIN